MPKMPESNDVTAQLADLERRLANLERAPQAPNTSQRGGSFKLIPEDGSPELLNFGTFTDGVGAEQYGVVMRDKDDAVVFATREDKEGLLMPFEATQWYVPTGQSITSATMVSVAECEVILPALPNIFFTAAIIVPVGTVAQVDVYNLNTGVVGTNVLSINGATGTVTCHWAHPYAVGWGDTDPYSLLLQYRVRRVSGAGTITAFPPRGLNFTSDILLGASAVTPLTFA